MRVLERTTQLVPMFSCIEENNLKTQIGDWLASFFLQKNLHSSSAKRFDLVIIIFVISNRHQKKSVLRYAITFILFFGKLRSAISCILFYGTSWSCCNYATIATSCNVPSSTLIQRSWKETRYKKCR